MRFFLKHTKVIYLRPNPFQEGDGDPNQARPVRGLGWCKPYGVRSAQGDAMRHCETVNEMGYPRLQQLELGHGEGKTCLFWGRKVRAILSYPSCLLPWTIGEMP